MEETIKIIQHFTEGQLYDSCCALLHHLKVSFSEVTAEPVPFVQLYPGNMPKGLQSIVEKVDATYYIGQVDSETLSGGSKAKTIEEVEQLTSQGKYEGMMIFAVDIHGGHHITRSEMASLTRGFNRIASAQPVILFIRHGNLLSLATCERMEYTQQWRNGEKLGKVSILRDINCRKPHHGHIDILEQLGDKSYTTFDELYRHWMDVFSSELLTKKFYGELSDWYAWAIKVARFPNDITSDNVDKPMNDIAVIRLITRLIFVWFLYCKRLIPKEFFDIGYIHDHLLENFTPDGRQPLLYDPEKSCYYRAILQNLFFAMLNRPIVADGKDKANNRRFMPRQTYHGMNPGYNVNNLMRYEKDFIDGGADEFLQLANSRVPFLNGGLFDCLDDKPNNKYFDGFSERKESLAKLHVPDYLFFGGTDDADLSEWYGDKRKKHIRVEGIIDIFKRYYFTVEENTPLDQEVSLDPELLGKSFENLLAAYVPETGTNARKQTGSFYTPRDEVQYMVVESLVAHLTRVCGAENENTYRSLLSYSEEEVKMTDELRMNIMLALYNCRILDPACGSGAFPMGMLQMMVHALRRIDPENSMWRSLMIDQATIQAKQAFGTNDEQERQERLADIENAFNRSVNDPDYARKLYLIEHCIYGVDIQPIAIQISKLRFFISLIVDQRPTTDASKNFGIRPLPNLEANFVAANTLIPVNYDHTLVDGIPEVAQLKDELKELNHQVFLAGRNFKKKEIKRKIEKTRKALAKAIDDSGFVETGVANQLASWDMFDQNASSPFFDPEWMFGVKGGFDVVIGNPPYVQLQNNGGALAKMYEGIKYKTFARTGDLYCLFYERGWQLLQKGGFLCFITSNKWMRAGYGEKIRGFFANYTNPILLIDFAGVKVFESATVDTNILLFERGKNQHHTICAKITNAGVNNLSLFVRQKHTENSFGSSDSWAILSPIEQSIKNKVEVVGVPLKDWNINIYRGILTGCNEAFIITTEKRNEILAKCRDEEERKRTEELIRPILRGRDIKRYGYNWAGLWLINAHNGIKGKLPRIDINDYPAIKAHLDQYWNEIMKRTDKGDTPYNLRNCAYMEDFDKPKIIYPNMTKYMPFMYDDENFLTNQKCFIITGEHIEFLTVIFNSSLFKYCFRDSFPELQGGTREMSKIFFDKIPIIKVSSNVNNNFSQLLISIQKNYTREKAIQIDEKLFDLYNLTQEERSTIGFVEIN